MTIFKLTPYTYLKRFLAVKLLEMLTVKSPKFFFRGGDTISFLPQIEGMHEPHLTKFIDKTAENGFSDFLIDIGANIGLTSCQSGNKFKKVYCFEPNPLCVNILKTNLAIALKKNNTEIFDFALGDNDGEFDLYVPKHNWGGAFVIDGNDYSEDVLSKKDRFEKFNEENYIVDRVKLKNTEDVFKDLFSSIISKNLYKGVIKIDVEGFEQKVLLGIANKLPLNLNVTIVFENWDTNFDLKRIKGAFKNRCVSCFKLKQSIVGTNKTKLKKFFEFILFGNEITLADIEENEDTVGDIVFMID